MDGLLSICDREGIEISYHNPLTRSGNILGFYCRLRNGQPLILLDESLVSRPRLQRCVLAEEVSHHMTGSVGRMLYPCPSRLSRRSAWQRESAATRWAVNYLIPTTALACAAKRGIFLPSELADHFDVEEYIVWRKFHVLRTDLREQWKLRVAAPDVMSPLLVATMWGEAVQGGVECA